MQIEKQGIHLLLLSLRLSRCLSLSLFVWTVACWSAAFEFWGVLDLSSVIVSVQPVGWALHPAPAVWTDRAVMKRYNNIGQLEPIAETVCASWWTGLPRFSDRPDKSRYCWITKKNVHMEELGLNQGVSLPCPDTVISEVLSHSCAATCNSMETL